MQYFISDQHFNHQLAADQRGYHSVAEMNADLIASWNAVVKKPKDEVYILGDFSFRGTAQDVNTILRQLRGKKYLVRGNHDEYLNDPAFDQSAFVWVKDYYEFRYQHRLYCMSHYPILEWNQYYKGGISLHGHVHAHRREYFQQFLSPNAVNVGVDVIGMRPIAITDLDNEIDGNWAALLKVTKELLIAYNPQSADFSERVCERLMLRTKDGYKQDYAAAVTITARFLQPFVIPTVMRFLPDAILQALKCFEPHPGLSVIEQSMVFDQNSLARWVRIEELEEAMRTGAVLVDKEWTKISLSDGLYGQYLRQQVFLKDTELFDYGRER